MLISFVIPCYGSEHTIENVVKEIKDTVQSKNDELGIQKYDYEIILVNDNSPDNVINKLIDIVKADTKVKAIDLSRNFGQHAALMAGYAEANGSVIVSLDDDGQTPASEVFSMINKLDGGYDVVYAKYEKKKHSLFRNLGSYINDKMMMFTLDKPKDLFLSSYFVAKAFVIKEILKYKNPYPYLGGLILRTTNKVGNVKVNHRDRQLGESGYDFRKLIALWINGFTAFSIKPLRVSILVGYSFVVLGFGIGIYTIINKMINDNVLIGWSSLMAMVTFTSGVILIMLGMIGEYVGRIYISLNNSPQYVVREKIYLEEKIEIYDKNL